MKHTLIIISVWLTLAGEAQDQLFKKDNTKINVKILEVGPDEIKYKLYDNQNGPTYIESKKNVNVIIYQNGQHEVINTTTTLPAKEAVPGSNNTMMVPELEKFDSLIYYRYRHNISINFFNFFNNEVGLIYQREFFSSHFNIIIPVAFGVEKPNVTESVYFQNRNNGFTLDRKLYEVGFGIHYYPSFKTNVNYFIGPVFRYQKYDGTQTYYTYGGGWPFGGGVISTKNTTLSRYCMSITNGFVIRTRSRLTTTLFGSIGFKNDVIDNPIIDPGTGAKVVSISAPLSLYFWTGFNVGFNF